MNYDFSQSINHFFLAVAGEEMEIYNEISLQIELGIHFRSSLPRTWNVLFEKPTTDFGLRRGEFIKKEIDIVVNDTEADEKTAIELKFPRQGQYPEQMCKFCQDIAFLEQLKTQGFTQGFFVCVVDNVLFYHHEYLSGIYGYFRGGKILTGEIKKPTGLRDASVIIRGSYLIEWKTIKNTMRYAAIEIH